MSNQAAIDWTAAAVRKAIEESGRTKRSISDSTGIPYPTLNRKLDGKGEFSFSDLLAIAESLTVPPARFTPPAFLPADMAAAS